jgi:hypothetical protein
MPRLLNCLSHLKDMNTSAHMRFYAEAIAYKHQLDTSKNHAEELPPVLANIPITRLSGPSKDKGVVQSVRSFTALSHSGLFKFSDSGSSTTLSSSLVESSNNASKKFTRFDSTMALASEVSGMKRKKLKENSKRNLQLPQASTEQLLRLALNLHSDAKLWIKRLWGGLLRRTSSVRDLAYYMENVHEMGGKARESYEQLLRVSPNNVVALNCYASLLRDIFRFVTLFNLALSRCPGMRSRRI